MQRWFPQCLPLTGPWLCSVAAVRSRRVSWWTGARSWGTSSNRAPVVARAAWRGFPEPPSRVWGRSRRPAAPHAAARGRDGCRRRYTSTTPGKTCRQRSWSYLLSSAYITYSMPTSILVKKPTQWRQLRRSYNLGISLYDSTSLITRLVIQH